MSHTQFFNVVVDIGIFAGPILNKCITYTCTTSQPGINVPPTTRSQGDGTSV